MGGQKIFSLFLLLAAVTLAWFAAGPANGDADPPDARAHLPREKVVYRSERTLAGNWDDDFGLPGQFFAVVTDEWQWLRTKGRLAPTIVAQRGEAIETFFSENEGGAVIIAYLGEAPTGGYAVDIKEVRSSTTDDASLLTVVVRRRKPEPTDFVLQAFTYPYDVVFIAADRLPPPPYAVRFVDEKDNDLNESTGRSTIDAFR